MRPVDRLAARVLGLAFLFAGPAFCEYVAASPDGQSIMPVFGDLFVGEPLPQQGKLKLGDTPGFGMELRDKAMLVELN